MKGIAVFILLALSTVPATHGFYSSLKRLIFPPPPHKPTLKETCDVSMKSMDTKEFAADNFYMSQLKKAEKDQKAIIEEIKETVRNKWGFDTEDTKITKAINSILYDYMAPAIPVNIYQEPHTVLKGEKRYLNCGLLFCAIKRNFIDPSELIYTGYRLECNPGF